eukprot:Tbor_TRINITY_DN6189_c2_g1::TRINITY_DN6189_c2_g1_i3::g.21589::m.21589
MMPLKYTYISFIHDLGGEPLGNSPKTGKYRPNVEAESASVFGDLSPTQQSLLQYPYPQQQEYYGRHASGEPIPHYYYSPSELHSPEQYCVSPDIQNDIHLSPNPYEQNYVVNTMSYPQHQGNYRCEPSREPIPHCYSPGELHSQQ